ncbi:MAG: hypothetical protein H7833_10690 [Magnetococcus sp. DMHC-1]|nr:hypothetical protein [Magnetococcales bacterium]
MPLIYFAPEMNEQVLLHDSLLITNQDEPVPETSGTTLIRAAWTELLQMPKSWFAFKGNLD